MADDISASETRQFLGVFNELLDAARELVDDTPGGFTPLFQEHFGVDELDLPTVSKALLPADLVNQQLAIDALNDTTPNGSILGVDSSISRFGEQPTMRMLLDKNPHFRAQPVPVSWVERPTGIDEKLRCARAAVWLTHWQNQPVAIALLPGPEHGPPGSGSTSIDVMATTEEAAEEVQAELARLRHDLNVYRGKVLAFSFTEYGEFGLDFVELPAVDRDRLILPEADLASIDRHTIGIAKRADELRAAGRDIKRGLLLYGPPGTGKTHTIAYLVGQMPGRTTIILQGPSVGALGQAAAIARSFPPAMLVIEDVDLIAHSRGMPGMGENPMLFQLLNEMDGLAADSDLLFVLTTNRPDVLEPALAARPGRIDEAVEIRRPEQAARVRLLELYLEGIDHSITDLAAVAARLEGVSASFIKELCRRAFVNSLEDDSPLDQALLDETTTDLLERSAPIVQATLGAGGALPAAFEPDGPGPGGGYMTHGVAPTPFL